MQTVVQTTVYSCYTFSHHIIATPSLIIAQLTNDSSHPQCQSYSAWLADWTSHLKNSSHSIRVPPEATAITTPLQPKEWQRSLSAHPDTSLVTFFILGLTDGFKIGFNNPTFKLRSAHINLAGALQHPQVVDDYLKAEIAKHCVAGPFHKQMSRMPILVDLASSPSNTNPTNGD